MKNIFIYPTRKNIFYMFIFWQFLPVLIHLGAGGINWLTLVCSELVILGILCQWRLKPTRDMDEREIAIELKWKNRMFDLSYTMILIPMAILAVRPETQGWNVINSFVVPSFMVNTVLSLGLKRELGGFFYTTRK